MEITNFLKPIRQSSKGIVIIFAFNTFNFIKKYIVFFGAIGVSFIQQKTFAGITPTIMVLALIGLLLVILIIAILKYLNFKFYLSQDAFHLASGIINKYNTVIPKSKIQNVHIKQNFLQQLINVVSLKIETAGDQKSEIEISALDRPTALLLKKELYSKTIVDEAGTKRIEPLEKRDVYFKISPKRLLLEGLSQNHFKSFMLIALFIFGVYNEFKEVLDLLEIEDLLVDFFRLDENGLLNLIITNVIVVIVVVFMSFLFSVIKTFIVNFSLEVVENNKAIEINKGLFNKVSLSLTPSRIQNLVITTNRVKQYFGLHSLSVKQAMINVKQQRNFKIVALEKEQLSALINKLLVNYTREGDVGKPQSYFMLISAFKMLLFGVLLNGFALLFFGSSMLWINMLYIPLAFLYVYFAYKKTYYIISHNFITVGSGVIDTITNILETHKIQGIAFKQSVFQQRRDIASLVISTASKSVKIPYISKSEALIIYDFLLYKVESQKKDWM